MLDHEERFLFREEILNLANALAEPGALDNVEDLLADVTTSPRFDSDVFTLERSLQVMLGSRAGSTLVGLLTVTREVFDEVGEIGLTPEVHERLVGWRARFGLAIDNVEDLLADVTTSPRFDSDVFTLERSLQVMLGSRAGSTLVGLLTVTREVFDEVGEIGLTPEVHERLVGWRARFGLAIDNALNFLNNPDGIQGHNFGTQLTHAEGGLTLQGRLTLVRYNNEPQFFIADADVLLSMAADVMERLGEHLEPEMVEAELVTRLREAVDLIERRGKPRG